MKIIPNLKVSFEHFSKWNQMAIVKGRRWLAEAYEALNVGTWGNIGLFYTAI